MKAKTKKEIKGEIFFNLANSFSILRLLLTFVIVYMLFNDYSRFSIGIVFIIAAATDWFDGFFARKLNQTTKLGARLDQVMDRIFTIIIAAALLIFFVMTGERIMLIFLVLAREIIATPGFVLRLIKDKDAYGVRYIGKVTTFIQSTSLAIIILNIRWFSLDWPLYSAIATCIVGVIAGFDYLGDSIK